MEDLREEPELEEREQEEQEEEVEDEEVDETTALNNCESQILMKPPTPVRSALGREGNKKNDPNWFNNSTFKKPLLETNFSITGINEIKTQQIPMNIDRNTQNNNLPLRPQSLYLQNLTTDIKTRPDSIHVDKVDIKLLDVSNFQ